MGFLDWLYGLENPRGEQIGECVTCSLTYLHDLRLEYAARSIDSRKLRADMFQNTMGETIKWVLTLASGGAVGAIITYLLRRRSERLQAIPLIERVNRLIDPNLQGYVLARTKGEGQNRELEEVHRVREYQFTLRNTSTIHLHDAEIQFEFPAEDAEAWAERPARSKTTPILVNAQISGEWERGFRWRIPEFPSSDSMEFTFRVVNPPNSKNEYEVALYNSPQVVIERTNREPPQRRAFAAFREDFRALILPIFLLSFLAVEVIAMIASPTGHRSTTVNSGGCSLFIETSSSHVDLRFIQFFVEFGQHGPFLLDTSVLNTGSQKCFVQFEGQTVPTDTVDSGSTEYLWKSYTNDRPKLVPRTILFGLSGPTNKTVVNVYWGQPL
jgi:hypothetical protein